MPISHTSENIAHALLETVENWMPKYKETKLYVVSDNAANVKGACQSLPHQFNYRGCTLHTLQLIIQDASTEFSNYRSTIAKAKNIVSHFHRSSKSTTQLK